MKEYNIHPREIADKSSKENLFKAIKMALDIESEAIRVNTQSFNTKRYQTIRKITNYEELKSKAREIKEWSINNLQELIETLSNVIETRGGKVFIAENAEEAAKFVKDICIKHKAKLVVKSKSITSEEIELNSILEKNNIEVAETDLAEFILQVSKEQPSHIVAPAIHRSRESISELFKNHFVTDKPLNTGEELTQFARDILRNKFLSADIGISGANLIAAEEGAILLVESEGNIRLTTQLPAVHIAIAGIEKVIKSKKDFTIFIKLLAASGTGQLLTSYTNILEPPVDLPARNFNGRNDNKREFYLVLIDNGRKDILKDEELKEALYCIRCSACMNVCANFQTVGGHAFGGEVYTGGIGGAWTYITTRNLKKARFAELCTGCSRCIPNCPVKIDIPRLNTIIKARINKLNTLNIQKIFFARYSVFAKIASFMPGFVNYAVKLLPVRIFMEKFLGVEKKKEFPEFASKTFTYLFKHRTKTFSKTGDTKVNSKKIIIFSDIYTNYLNPNIGINAIEALEKLGFRTQISKVYDDGRASLSQGMVKHSEILAEKTSDYLKELIDDGYNILFLEPSVLAMVRYEYRKLIKNGDKFNQIRSKCYDIFEYLNMIIEKGDLQIGLFIHPNEYKDNKIFYHAHCQQKSIGIDYNVPKFFRSLGVDVVTSNQECCGMAGSFGYKKHYYEISKNVGQQLVNEVKRLQNNSGNVIVLASGMSCREQLNSFLKDSAAIYHPIEYLNKIILKDF